MDKIIFALETAVSKQTNIINKTINLLGSENYIVNRQQLVWSNLNEALQALREAKESDMLFKIAYAANLLQKASEETNRIEKDLDLLSIILEGYGMETKNKNTCTNCKYFDWCGDPTRKEPCDGKAILVTVPEGNYSVTDLYDFVATEIGYDPADCHYDCRKINIAANIQDGFYEYYKILARETDPTTTDNDIKISTTMLLVMSGPKVDADLKANEVEVFNGFIV